ncbi:MAG: flavin reductase family protein [Anaerolineales bacterium]|nr:flavin reductase family protein [Anaerolineales bacterium]
MKRIPVPYTYHLEETLKQLDDNGLLVAATNKEGVSNVMTIGWGCIGILWGKPTFAIMVRPSRYTYQFIESSDTFTVNVPPPEMKDYVLMCGTRSGRDVNKFNDYGMSISPGQTVSAVTLDACPLVYECKVLLKTDMAAENMRPAFNKKLYAQGDYHRIYYGGILGTFVTE